MTLLYGTQKNALTGDARNVGCFRFCFVRLQLARHLFPTHCPMSDSQPAPAKRAIFLSYASQDAEAVERSAVAQRAAGVGLVRHERAYGRRCLGREDPRSDCKLSAVPARRLCGHTGAARELLPPRMEVAVYGQGPRKSRGGHSKIQQNLARITHSLFTQGPASRRFIHGGAVAIGTAFVVTLSRLTR